MNEVKIVLDTLGKENKSKEREIKKMTEDCQHLEQIIMSLRAQNFQMPCMGKCDVSVSVHLCCQESQCGDVEPVRDYSALLKEESDKYEAKMTQLEDSLKSTAESQRWLRQHNVQLSDETGTLRRVCCALDEQCRAQTMRAQFQDDIIREMRRQLKQSKAKLREEESMLNTAMTQHNMSGDSASRSRPSEPRHSFRREHPEPPQPSGSARAGLDRGDAAARTGSASTVSRDNTRNGRGGNLSTTPT